MLRYTTVGGYPNTDPYYISPEEEAAMSDDHLKVPWCCLTCFHKFPIGKVMLGGGTGQDIPGNPQRLNCPSCRSVNIHPADSTYSINSYDEPL